MLDGSTSSPVLGTPYVFENEDARRRRASLRLHHSRMESRLGRTIPQRVYAPGPSQAPNFTPAAKRNVLNTLSNATQAPNLPPAGKRNVAHRGFRCEKTAPTPVPDIFGFFHLGNQMANSSWLPTRKKDE